jgi:hypothetical protein
MWCKIKQTAMEVKEASCSGQRMLHAHKKNDRMENIKVISSMDEF